MNLHAMTQIVLVNAGAPLTDAQIAASVPFFQLWDDTMLRPAWELDACTYSFMSWAEFQANTPDLTQVEPLFFNNHSNDSTILGFHDFQNGETFMRVFAGDCIRDGISWTVDASHEGAEARINPKLIRYKLLPNGDTALVEGADPVESDLYAIRVTIGGTEYLMTNFVLPHYFDGGPGPYDYRGLLTGPCPTLLDGGYQSLWHPGASQWSQITAMRDGKLSVRAERFVRSHRYPKVAP